MKAFLTALGILAIYVFIATHATLWDRDEPRFARATLEMMSTGNWLYPTFEGRLRPDKPILIYWLMAGSVKLLGPTELAFRLPSCLGAAGACWCTFLAARRLGAGRWAWWAMVFLATSLMPTILGTLATADGVLLFFLTAATTVLAYAWTTTQIKLSHVLLSGLLLGGAWLTKGPLGLFPVLSLALAGGWHRLRSHQLFDEAVADKIVTGSPPPPRFGGLIFFSLLISLILFLAWAIPANIATGSELARQGLGRHVVARILQPAEGHGGSNFWQYLLLLPFYLPMIIAGFFPWTLHLPGGIHTLWAGRLADRKTRAFLWGWILPVPILMSLFATKLPHYVMPIWPALAIVGALVLKHAHENRMSEWDHRWLRGGIWFFVPVGLGMGLALMLGPVLAARQDPILAPLANLQWVGGITGLWIMLMTILVTVMQLRERWMIATHAALLGSLGTLLLLWGWVIPRIEPILKLSPPVAQAIVAQTSAIVPVAVYGYYEPSLTFYLMRDRPEKLADDGAALKWLSDDMQNPRVLVTTGDRWERLESMLQSLPIRVLARVQGINHNEHGQAMLLLALLREPSAQP